MEIESKDHTENIKRVLRDNNLRVRVVSVTKTGPQKLEVLGENLNINSTLSQSISTQDESTTTNSQREQVQVVLEGVWSQNKILKNSIVHLVNPVYDEIAGTYHINNSVGFLINEPDSLLTCTYVASSLFCERKTWLNHVFQGQVGTNKAMSVGTLVHEVFQYGVKNRIADTDKLITFLDELLDDATVMLETYSVEQHITDIRKEAISYMSSVKEWIDKYMFSGPRIPLNNDSDLEVKIIGISDIEENVWSTKYGLKGKIDITGAVRIYDRKTKIVADKTIPLELKTGNPNLSASHAAQVSLYSMMIEDRYSETNQGFVIYLKDKAAMHNVALTHNIKRDLIQRRNQINSYMKDYYFGPEMLDQTRACTNCERLTECVLMSELYNPGKIHDYRIMSALKPEATGHLDEEFKEFFQKHHEKLVNLMTTSGDKESETSNSQSFWTYSSDEAEIRGTGFGRLTISEVDAENRLITFRRHPACKHTNKDSSSDIENDSQLTPPSPSKSEVVVIDDDGDDSKFLTPRTTKRRIEDFFKPAKKIKPASPQQDHQLQPLNDNNKLKPFNTELNFSRCRIAISLDNDDHNMDSQNSSTAIAIGFMSELKENHLVVRLYEGTLDTIGKPNLMYRVDKLEKRPPLDIQRLVLVRLLAREDWRCDRVRQLILDKNYKPKKNLELSLFVLSTAFEEVTDLRDNQQEFVVEAVATDNYYILNEDSLSLSKSSSATNPNNYHEEVHKVVSVFCKIVTKLDRTVLIVAENIDHLVGLMKLLKARKLKFILIDDGKSTKSRYHFAANLVKKAQHDTLSLTKKYEAYIRQHELAPIVITTYAMSIGGLLFTRRTFDYCIAYNCNSTELLVALAPMFCSDRHIIVDVKVPGVDKTKNSSGPDSKKNGDGSSAMNMNNISLGEHISSLNRL